MDKTTNQNKTKHQAQDKDLDSVWAAFKEDDSQPFDSDYQNRFLKVLISDRDGYAEQIIDVVQADYFDSYQKILLDYELSYFNRYQEIARFSALRDLVNDREKGMAKELLNGLLDQIEALPIDNVEHIKKRAYTYFKKKSLKNCIMKMVVNWKNGQYDSFKTDLEEALRAGEPKETGHNYVDDMEKRLIADFRNPISAMESIDKYIGGGLSQGEMGIVLAPTGGGKSMVLVKFATTALLAGKKVLYYTLELSEKAVGNRFDACINQLPIKDVWDFADVILENGKKIKNAGGSLVIKGFPSGQASINTLMSHVRTLKINDNFVPDIIFIDYGDLLKPLDNYSEKRHSLDSIYVGIRGMASELNIPIWNAAQTNRTGMDQENISLSSIGESLGNARAADVVIGIGRTPENKVENIATIGILKNRNGADGFYLPCFFNTSKIFIEIQAVDPTMIMAKKSDKGSKKTNEPQENISLILSDLVIANKTKPKG